MTKKKEAENLKREKVGNKRPIFSFYSSVSKSPKTLIL